MTDGFGLMRGIKKCNKIGLMVKKFENQIFEKGAIPKYPVYYTFSPLSLLSLSLSTLSFLSLSLSFSL
jgi:hypothetical protein